MNRNTGKEKIVLFVFCAFLGAICIAINSMNSFLYEFTENNDVHCFVTTARCMLRGDVLYRDIYEHKGPILYFLYMIGLLIDSDSFIGIAFIETIFYSVYILFMYKICELYVDKRFLCYVITAIAAWISCNDISFDGGGQCEELALPFLCITMYIVLRYFKNEYPKKIKAVDTFLIGLCFSIVFLMKYTLVGIYVGLVLLIIVCQIKDKNIKRIWIYMLEFLAGVLAGALPAIVYFGINGGFDSFMEVYFYKLLFNYTGGSYDKVGFFDSFLSETYLREHMVCTACYIAAILYCFAGNKKHFNKNEKIAVVTMIVSGIAIKCVGYEWYYSTEYVCAFSILGVLVAYFVIYDNRGRFRYCADKAMELAENVVTLGSDWMDFCVLIVSFVVLPLGSESFLKLFRILIGIMIARLLKHTEQWKALHGVKVILFKYAVIVLLLLIPYKMIKFSCLIACVLLLLRDIRRYPEQSLRCFQKIVHILNTMVLKKRMMRVMLCFFAGIAMIACTMFTSKYSRFMMDETDCYPQYRMAYYINQGDIQDPNIIYWDCLDLGIYWLTDTYPPYKYFCFYNLRSDEIPNLFREGMQNGEIDYVVATKEQNFQSLGFELVYYGEREYRKDESRDYYLYKRITQ